MDNIRNIILIITGFSTIIGFCLKWTNNLMIELIRSKLRVVPCKNSIFETSSKFICILLSALSLSFMFTYKPAEYLVDNTEAYSITATIIVVIIVGMYLCSLIIAQFNFSNVQDLYMRKLMDNKNIEITNRLCKLIRIGKGFAAISGAFTSIIAVGSISLYLDNTNENYIGAISVSIIAITSILLYFIYESAFTIISDLKINETYRLELKGDGPNIVCSVFLDIGDFYVYNENGKLQYIRQSDIHKIYRCKNS